MKSWRATQAGLQKVMNIPWCGAILRNCHSEWSEIKIIFHPDKKTNQYKSRKDICLPDAALNPRQGLTACTIKCQSDWSIKTGWLYNTYGQNKNSRAFREIDLMDTIWNATLINSHLQQSLIIFLALTCKIEKLTMRNGDEYASLVQHAMHFHSVFRKRKIWIKHLQS